MFMIFIIVINLGVNLLFKYKGSAKFLNIFISNCLGNNLESYNFNKTWEYLFFKDSLGYDLDNDEVNTNRNIKEYLGSDLVYIFNTFQTDKYKSSNEENYNVLSVVVQASLILEEYLKDRGIKCIIDLDNKEIGYQNVREVIENNLKNYKNIKYIIDIGISNDNDMSQEIEKEKYAKIRFKVSKNNSNYEANLKFAKALEEKIEAYNLSGGVVIVSEDINQDLKDNMMMLEVGSHENTIEEVNRTLKILAKVLGDYIKDGE